MGFGVISYSIKNQLLLKKGLLFQTHFVNQKSNTRLTNIFFSSIPYQRGQ